MSRGYRKPKIPIIIPDRVAERAATRYEKDESNCWISTYSVASHGYAQIGWSEPGYRQVVTAHRAAWVYHSGKQIPEGITIDHVCRNCRCVNPVHLRDLPNFENARRTFGRDWELGACIRGHSNEYLAKDRKGKRYCSVCAKGWKSHPSRSGQPRKPARPKPPKPPSFDPIEDAVELLNLIKARNPDMSQRALSNEISLMRPTIRKIEKRRGKRVTKSVTKKLQEYLNSHSPAA